MLKKTMLSATEKRDWLRLARTENVGPITFRQLLRRFGSAGKAIEVLPELAKRGGAKRSYPLPSLSVIDREIAALEKLGGKFITLCEPEYPEALASIEDAPPVISVIGNISLLKKRCISIVGARNASLNGRKMAERLAYDLGKEGMVIVSGLARGIDSSAHKASLDSGTIAVMASGVDIVYPEENRALYEQIAKRGAVISDQPLGVEPRAQMFPRRNRLISGLSLGVIVVEAAKKSGSLITARLALEQGREVFAVPGSPLDPRAHGTNGLIKQGAVLTESAIDVLSHIHAPVSLQADPSHGFEDETKVVLDESDLSSARAKIIENLGASPVSVDELIRQFEFPPAVILMSLLELELAGKLERYPGNMVAAV